MTDTLEFISLFKYIIEQPKLVNPKLYFLHLWFPPVNVIILILYELFIGDYDIEAYREALFAQMFPL